MNRAKIERGIEEAKDAAQNLREHCQSMCDTLRAVRSSRVERLLREELATLDAWRHTIMYLEQALMLDRWEAAVALADDDEPLGT